MHFLTHAHGASDNKKKKKNGSNPYLELILAVGGFAGFVDLDGDLLINSLDSDKELPAVGGLALQVLLQESLTALAPGPVAELTLGVHETSHGGELGEGGGIGRVTLETGGVLLGQELGRVLARSETFVGDNLAKQGDVVGNTLDDIGVQGTLHVLDSLLTGGTVGAELADHGIIVDRDLGTLNDSRVATDLVLTLGRAGLDVLGKTTNRGEVLLWILGVDTGLDSPSVNLDVLLLGGQLLVGSNTDHLLDQIHTGNVLSDRVLDLKTGVHLEEVKVAGRVNKELDGTSRRVLDVLGQHDGLLSHGLAGSFVNVGRGCLLNDLLVSALNRALSLGQVELFQFRGAEYSIS